MKSLKKILYWMLGLFGIYLTIEIIRKIFGGSLETEAIIIGLLIANLGYVIGLHGKISDVNSKLSGHIGWHKGKR